jgi:hypothetical protein
MFRLDPLADTAGMHRVDDIEIPPAVLVGMFGPPGRGSDDGKVSGFYRFTSNAGEVFTLYDWKATTLYYDADPAWPTPEEFWAGTEPVPFGIGGHGEENEDGLNLGATAFREWLVKRWLGYASCEVN